MRKQILALAALIMLSATAIFTQEVKWGKFNKGKNTYAPTIIGEDEHGLYTAIYDTDWKIEAFNKKDFSPKYSLDIKAPKIKGEITEIEKIKYFGNKFICFYSSYNKKSKKYELFANIIDSKTGKFKNKQRSIVKLDVEKRRRSGDFWVTVSENNSKVFIEHAAYYKKLKKKKRKYFLLDNELTTLFEKELDSEDFMPSSYIVDNDGSIYYIGLNSSNSIQVGSFDANRDYEEWKELVTFHNEKPESDKYGLELNINAKNDLTITGFVSDPVYKTKKNGKKKKKGDELSGAFFVRIDNISKEKEAAQLTYYGQKFKDQFKTAKEEKKDKDAGVENTFNSVQIFDKEDGGVVVVGETYTYHANYDSDGNLVGEYIEYGDLIINDFTDNGELAWSHRVPKKQVFSWGALLGNWVFTSSRGIRLFLPPNPQRTTQFFSYVCGLKDDKLIIVFNDTDKNNSINSLKIQEPAKFKKPNKSSIGRYEIDIASGKKVRSVATKIAAAGAVFKPSVSYQKKQGDNIYILSQKGAKYKYGVIQAEKK